MSRELGTCSLISSSAALDAMDLCKESFSLNVSNLNFFKICSGPMMSAISGLFINEQEGDLFGHQ